MRGASLLLLFLSLDAVFASMSIANIAERNRRRIEALDLIEEERASKISAMVSRTMTRAAAEEMQKFAPVTDEGRNRLLSLAESLGDFPFVSTLGLSISEDPTSIINFLESLRGTYFLAGLYRYIGGDIEVQAHQELIQASAMKAESRGVIGMGKAIVLLTGANILLAILVGSEVYEYLNFKRYRPGIPTEDYKPPELTRFDLVLRSLKQPIISKISGALEKAWDLLSGPMTKIFHGIGRVCHYIITQEEMESRPYMKFMFVWIILMISITCELAIISAAVYAMGDLLKHTNAVAAH